MRLFAVVTVDRQIRGTLGRYRKRIAAWHVYRKTRQNIRAQAWNLHLKKPADRLARRCIFDRHADNSNDVCTATYCTLTYTYAHFLRSDLPELIKITSNCATAHSMEIFYMILMNEMHNTLFGKIRYIQKDAASLQYRQRAMLCLILIIYTSHLYE